MSELPNNLRNLAKTVNEQDKVLVETLIQAANQIDHLESRRCGTADLQDENDRLRAELHRCSDVIRDEREKVKAARDAEEAAEKVIEDIAKAAGCDNFADIILARVTAMAQVPEELRSELRHVRGLIDEANNLIQDLCRAVELPINAGRDVLIGRVSALHQQSNAMTRICEGHIVTSRRMEQQAKDYLAANKQLSTRIDELNNQNNLKRATIHCIADELGMKGRDELPKLEWILCEIRALKDNGPAALETLRAVTAECLGEPGLRAEEISDRFRGLDIARLRAAAADAEAVKQKCEARVKELETALEQLNALETSKEVRWDKAKNEALKDLLKSMGFWPSLNDVEGLKALKDRCIRLGLETAEAKEGRQKAENELALGVAAIKRMYAKLEEYRTHTGIWPNDNRLRAKLDDIEWCLNVYLSKFAEMQNLHAADTRFIADVRDSLSHEILRRNCL